MSNIDPHPFATGGGCGVAGVSLLLLLESRGLFNTEERPFLVDELVDEAGMKLNGTTEAVTLSPPLDVATP